MGEFLPNLDFPGSVIRDNPDLDALMEEAGAEVLASAETLSAPFHKTGAWQGHLHGDLKHADGYPYYRTEDDRDAAVDIEFGTSKTPAHRALGRAIHSAEI